MSLEYASLDLYHSKAFSSCWQFHSAGLYGLLDKLYDLVEYCNILAYLAMMNLADSVRSQDNINKVVSQEREYNLLPKDRVTDISICW